MEKDNDQIIEEENNIDHLEVKILDAQKTLTMKKFQTEFNFILSHISIIFKKVLVNFL